MTLEKTFSIAAVEIVETGLMILEARGVCGTRGPFRDQAMFSSPENQGVKDRFHVPFF
jgi:hypothetical protein